MCVPEITSHQFSRPRFSQERLPVEWIIYRGLHRLGVIKNKNKTATVGFKK